MEHTATSALKNRVSRFAVMIADFCNKIFQFRTFPLPALIGRSRGRRKFRLAKRYRGVPSGHSGFDSFPS
jgi:hypothetical protein